MSLFLTEVNPNHLSHLSHTLYETSQYKRRCCIVSSSFIHSEQRLHCILIPLLTRFVLEGSLSSNTLQLKTLPESGVFRSQTFPYPSTYWFSSSSSRPYDQNGLCKHSYPPSSNTTHLMKLYSTEQ